MEYTTPEKVGISSKNIKKYIESLEEAQLSMHDVIIYRKGKIVFEKYWAPFTSDFKHRMYSVTKSFVGLGIGFLEQDGLISLDDKIGKYFPEEIKNQTDENMKNQTIRHMLMMSTAKPPQSWFNAKPEDRVALYFENDSEVSRPSGTIFQYDSPGAFVLGALIERVSGMEFVEYLQSKFMNKLGVAEDTYCLKCPGGHAWADSALICRPVDLLKCAVFTMNKGRWNGEQLLNEEYVTAATSKQIDNNCLGDDELASQGYGYQFWRTYDNSFFFNGMGCQFAVCIPDKDMVFVCNADNQGKDFAKRVIIKGFFDMVARTAVDGELPEDKASYDELMEYTSELKLMTAKGLKHIPLQDKINGVEYVLDKNPMGITKMKFCFEGDKGTLYYTNAQGDKELSFGMRYNEAGEFPEDGYSDEMGTIPGNRRYDCVASAAWHDEQNLFIKVQVIDTYFGNLNINIGFTPDGRFGMFMNKTAEGFLDKYQGFACAKPLV